MVLYRIIVFHKGGRLGVRLSFPGPECDQIQRAFLSGHHKGTIPCLKKVVYGSALQKISD